MQHRHDSAGDTYYVYDTLGRVTAAVRTHDGTCAGPFALASLTDNCGTQSVGSGAPDAHPNTLYAYDANGRLTGMKYPHGRRVTYEYGDGTTSAPLGRVTAVDVYLATPSCASARVLSSVQWEPYGGLRSYKVNPPGVGAPQLTVEYLLGDNASTAPSQFCPTSRPAGGDHTGRLRALWVSTGALTGDVFKRTYAWQTDQLQAQYTCLLGSSTPLTEYFGDSSGNGYDALLRLVHASRPSGDMKTVGGPFGHRDYTYDNRGNRLTENDECWSFQETYDGTYKDRLVRRSFSGAASCQPGCTQQPNSPYFTQFYEYDADGRVLRKAGPDSETGGASDAGTATFELDFDTSITGTQAAVGAVYKAVHVNGADYEYFYDADGHRRFKSYPLGGGTYGDEYFWNGDNVIEDRGLMPDPSAGYSPSQPRPLDEYIYLDGRPVVYVKSDVQSTTPYRAQDLTGQCTRNGEPAPCGVYFPVSDYLGKVVVLLDSNGKVAGTGEYDAFGHVNRANTSGKRRTPTLWPRAGWWATSTPTSCRARAAFSGPATRW